MCQNISAKSDPIAQEDREQINYDFDSLKICSTIHLFTSVTKEVIHTHCAVNTNHRQRHCLLLPMFKLILNYNEALEDN